MSNFQKLYKKDGIIYEARTCGGWRGEFVSFSEKDSNEIKIIHEDRFNEFIKDYEEVIMEIKPLNITLPKMSTEHREYLIKYWEEIKDE